MSMNPFIRGAYSEPLIGCTELNTELLGQNIDNLYFAGEATSDWHGYMQGAYLSGQEKGRILAKLVRSSSELDSTMESIGTILIYDRIFEL